MLCSVRRASVYKVIHMKHLFYIIHTYTHTHIHTYIHYYSDQELEMAKVSESASASAVVEELRTLQVSSDSNIIHAHTNIHTYIQFNSSLRRILVIIFFFSHSYRRSTLRCRHPNLRLKMRSHRYRRSIRHCTYIHTYICKTSLT